MKDKVRFTHTEATSALWQKPLYRSWANLKRNWYLPFSAIGYYFLGWDLPVDNLPEYHIGMIIAFAVVTLLCSQIDSLREKARQQPLMLKLFCAVSALGICLGGQERFYVQALKLLLPEKFNIYFLLLSYLGAIIAIPFLYCLLIYFWDTIGRIFQENGTFTGITKKEGTIYGALILITIILVCDVFASSEAFYGTEYAYDLIYTSDSPALLRGNVYLSLTHQENDLRQPLFAAFASPFISVPYFIGRLVGVSKPVHAMLMNGAQVIMLFAANFMITRMMNLSQTKRVLFMLLACSVYTFPLFSLMMEQYIVAYFWLIFCCYLICSSTKAHPIAFWGAGGTLLTSVVLLPLTSRRSPLKDFKGWFLDLFRHGFSFVLVMLVLCRFDVIFTVFKKIKALKRFSGHSIPVTDKLFQYTEFVRNCFFAPKAGVSHAVADHISWQMDPVSGVSILGISLFILAVISAIVNRKKKSSLVSFYWVCFSVIMLFILGWGTKENGLILYALYFGWAFLVLIFQLIEKLDECLGRNFMLPCVCITAVIILCIVNIPAMIQMVDFAITYFPA